MVRFASSNNVQKCFQEKTEFTVRCSMTRILLQDKHIEARCYQCVTFVVTDVCPVIVLTLFYNMSSFLKKNLEFKNKLLQLNC